MLTSIDKCRVGLSGTGFIASGLARLMQKHAAGLRLSRVLTRRSLRETFDFPQQDRLTQSLSDLIDQSDVIVECSGDVPHAADVVDLALKAGKPVVTMNSEFHVTLGSYFADKGVLTEAEGDQPGCLAALHEEALIMGFSPVAYVNIKGFLNHDPTIEDMTHWSQKQGIRLAQTTSFTDGTKIQIEQAFVANGLGATITGQGLAGPKVSDIAEGARELARIATDLKRPIADYILAPGAVPGVFVVATHDASERSSLRYLKLGDGPYYGLLRNYHLCQYEILKTVRRVLHGGGVLLNNSSSPSVSVVAIAKHDMPAGTQIEQAIGGFQCRGEAARIVDVKNHVPIGVIRHARLTRKVERGQMLTFDDVELPESLALEIAHRLYGRDYSLQDQ